MTLTDEDALLRRITTNPDIFGGKPIIEGKRLAVEHVLTNLAAGDTVEDVLGDYPFIDRDDVRACLLYAARRMNRQTVAAFEQDTHAAPR